MASSLRWTTRAERELDDAMTYLEERELGLGMALLADVTALVSRVMTMPRLYPEVAPGIRRGLIRRFSYNIFYSQPREDLIVILALIHTAASPDEWPEP